MRSRLLPRGAGDLLWQIVLFCGPIGSTGWSADRSSPSPRPRSITRGEIVDVERALHVFFEPAVQRWALGTGWVDDVGAWMYINTHFVVTTCTLAFIYLFRNEHFYFVRNMFMVAMGLALVGYVLYPDGAAADAGRAGVRRLGLGLHGRAPPTPRSTLLFNPYAAVPSMHVGFALMLAVPMIRIARRRWIKALWIVYPPVVTAVVVVTANHWVVDAAAGAAVAAVSAFAAQTLFARVRPRNWAWTADEALPAPAQAG